MTVDFESPPRESGCLPIHPVNSSASLGSAAGVHQAHCRCHHHCAPPPLNRHHSCQSSQSSKLFLGLDDPAAASDYISRASSFCSLCSGYRKTAGGGLGSEVPSSLASRESLYWADIEQGMEETPWPFFTCGEAGRSMDR